MTHTREDKTPNSHNGVRLTTVGPWRVSTVNLDRVTGPQRDILFLLRMLTSSALSGFETMVFKGSDSSELDVAHYGNEADAIAGHEAMVVKWAERPVPT